MLVDGHGRVVLADMGCATPLRADDDAARAFRWFLQPATAAPEQFTVDGAFSPATDTWSLGVLLFELRYGRHPFWTDAPDALPFDLRTQRALRYAPTAVGGGEFHRELVSFLSGVARAVHSDT